MKTFYVISLLVVAALALCPFYLLPDEDKQQFDRIIVSYSPNGEPQYKENPVCSYRSYMGEIRSIDPTTCGDTSSGAVQGSIYDGIYCYAYLARENGRPVIQPCLAEAMPEISDDYLTYRIKLKKGVVYHRNPCFGTLPNGTNKTREVVADDFILAFKRCADYHNVNTSTSWAFLAGRIVGLDEFRAKTQKYKAGDFSRFNLPVKGIKSIDKYTLEIKLKQPYPQFTMVLALNNYAPCPREAVNYWLAGEGNPEVDGEIPMEQRSVEFREAKMVVGTGAYCLDTFQRKNKYILVRNPDFRDEYYPSEGSEEDREQGLLDDAGKKLPFIDVVYVRYVAENYTIWNLFLTKQIDSSSVPRDAFEFVITPDKKLSKEWQEKGIYSKSISNPVIYWMVFNMDDPILGQSPSLRKAICLAFDAENYIKVLASGMGIRAKSIVPYNFQGYTPGPYYRLDIEAAKAYIEKAKQELAAKNLLDENGRIPELSCELVSGLMGKRSAEYYSMQFRKIGLRFKPVFNDWPTLLQKIHSKQGQIYTLGWAGDYYDSENFLQLFYSPNIAKGTNESCYSNPEFDRLYEKIKTMPDNPQRTAIYKKMIEMVCEDCPVLPTIEPFGIILLRDWYKNVKLNPMGYGYTKYQRIDAELRKRQGGL